MCIALVETHISGGEVSKHAAEGVRGQRLWRIRQAILKALDFIPRTIRNLWITFKRGVIWWALQSSQIPPVAPRRVKCGGVRSEARARSSILWSANPGPSGRLDPGRGGGAGGKAERQVRWCQWTWRDPMTDSTWRGGRMKNDSRNPTRCIWTPFAKRENKEGGKRGGEFVPDDCVRAKWRCPFSSLNLLLKELCAGARQSSVSMQSWPGFPGGAAGKEPTRRRR